MDPKPKNQAAQKTRRKDQRQGNDLDAVRAAFLLSPHEDVRAFLAEAGLPLSIRNAKIFVGLAEYKRATLSRLRETLLEDELKARVTEMEKMRSDAIKDYAAAAKSLHLIAMARVRADMMTVQQRKGESNEVWLARVTVQKQMPGESQADYDKRKAEMAGAMSPGEVVQIGMALKLAQDMTWRTAAMDGYQWASELENQRKKNKARKMEITIIEGTADADQPQLPAPDGDEAEVG